jgi:glyoxylase-like metal-dependent hydrolase (beta-lactamase superfamily II)
MRVHHLNCATFCPIGGNLLWGPRCGPLYTRFICHCLVVETDAGLVLVDTGLGLQDVAHPYRRFGVTYKLLLRPVCDPREAAANQVERLGFRRTDVRHIVLTHLDRDHAGGLPDFPAATVHVADTEYREAMARAGRRSRMRYQPSQWRHGPMWARYMAGGERWLGFDGVSQLRGLPPEILLIPLPGHTGGHCGVAIDIAEGWLLHAGDAYYHAGEIGSGRRWQPPGLALTQWLIDADRGAGRANRERLRAVADDGGNDVAILCSHDPAGYPVKNGSDGR